MKIKNIKLTFSDIAGIGTLLLVFGLSLYILPRTSLEIQDNIWPVSFLFFGYLTCFMLITREGLLPDSRPLYLSILALKLLIVYLIMWLLPFSFLPILTIIWAAMLPHFFSLKSSVIITLLVVIGSSVLYGFHWDNENYLFQGALYFTFHLFALFMMQNAKLAEDANARAQSLNKELQATQQLLAQVSRQNERTRIARDLHDLLGHHLTALIINLQVASHLTEGEAKSKVDQCYSLSKLLLSDVREAVTAIRENNQLDFRKMVELMIADIPRLKITSHIDTQLNLEDLDLAKALLSCIQEAITNSLRHSGASEFWINMKLNAQSIELELLDNGQTQGKNNLQIIQGNGLKGMKERIEALGGVLKLDKVHHALKINIVVPLLIKNKINNNLSVKNGDKNFISR